MTARLVAPSAGRDRVLPSFRTSAASSDPRNEHCRLPALSRDRHISCSEPPQVSPHFQGTPVRLILASRRRHPERETVRHI